MADNSDLSAAKAAKKDEFYTEWNTIEEEMNAYVEYDPEVFRDKTILCPCDDPEWSNFTKYFAQNFERYGLKKLISTSYAKSPFTPELSLFQLEKDSALYDEKKHKAKGKLYILEHDANGSGHIDVDDIEFKGYLEHDGDFQSDEVKKLRDEADIIITNPPFSQFRAFLSWILDAGKKFIIIGNLNAITFKDVFPYLQHNEIWLGYSIHSGDRKFTVPDDYPLDAAGCGVDEHGKRFIRVKGVRWYTNIEHGLRHEDLRLDTMAHNLKFNKKLRKKLESKYGIDYYPHFDNYDALEVPITEAIPSDYDGIMGVPISFFDKYNPAQFDVLGYTAKDMGVECLKFYKDLEQSKNGKDFVRNMKSARYSPMVPVAKRPKATCYRAKNVENFIVKTYGRVLIRRKAQ